MHVVLTPLFCPFSHWSSLSARPLHLNSLCILVWQSLTFCNWWFAWWSNCFHILTLIHPHHDRHMCTLTMNIVHHQYYIYIYIRHREIRVRIENIISEFISHSSNEHPVQPSQSIWTIISLGTVHHNTTHTYCRRLLIKSGSNVLRTHWGVCPTKTMWMVQCGQYCH